MTLREFITKINGVSTPFIGISWNIPESESEIMYDLMQYLADKRIIDYNHGILSQEGTILSLRSIRNDISNALVRMNEDAKSRHYLESMRQSIEYFQTYIEQAHIDEQKNLDLNDDLIEAVKEFRKKLSSFFQSIDTQYNFEMPSKIRENYLTS